MCCTSICWHSPINCRASPSMAWACGSRAVSWTVSRTTSSARLALDCRRRRRCRESASGLMRWNSTSDLLEISSSRSRRSAVTRRTRLRRSSACSPPACPAGSSSLSSLAAADAGSGASGAASGRPGVVAGSSARASGRPLRTRPSRRCTRPSISSRPAPSAQPASPAGGVPIRSNRSQPWSNASICSDCRSRRPSCASTRQSSMTCATRTPASSPTIRAAPFSECAARMQASSWSAWVGLRSSAIRPALSTWVWASASSRNSSSSDASLIWSGVMPGSALRLAGEGLRRAG